MSHPKDSTEVEQHPSKRKRKGWCGSSGSDRTRKSQPRGSKPAGHKKVQASPSKLDLTRTHHISDAFPLTHH